jgi:hypothetical protein
VILRFAACALSRAVPRQAFIIGYRKYKDKCSIPTTVDPDNDTAPTGMGRQICREGTIGHNVQWFFWGS